MYLAWVKKDRGFVEVWVPVAMPKPLTYSLDGVEDSVLPGMRVVVRVGMRKRYTGFVAAVFSELPAGVPEAAVRPVDAVVDDRPVVSASALHLWRWMAAYYMLSLIHI